jgi:hypothetical protein
MTINKIKYHRPLLEKMSTAFFIYLVSIQLLSIFPLIHKSIFVLLFVLKSRDQQNCDYQIYRNPYAIYTAY